MLFRSDPDAVAAAEEAERAAELRDLGIRSLVALAVAGGIMALMATTTLTGLSMDEVNRLVLWPATFVQFWAGGRFIRHAWGAARHRTVTMDTLVAVGTLAAWGYSAIVTTWPSWSMNCVEASARPMTQLASSTSA